VWSVRSPVAEPEPVEGLFDVLAGVRGSAAPDAEHLAVGDVLLHLPLAEDHGAVGALRPGTGQQDAGSMASVLQQSGWDANTSTVTQRAGTLWFHIPPNTDPQRAP